MMEKQPLLPVYEDPKDLEYYPDGEDGVPWAVKDWRGLKQAFGIEAHELVSWHKALVNPQSRPWIVTKRIYGVVAMIGEAVEDDDDLDWTWASLAKKFGVPEKVLREDFDAAVDFWKKESLSRSIQQVKGVDPVKPMDALAGANPRMDLADEKISELLEEYRFGHLKGNDRVFVARRITEMIGLFQDKNRREVARQLVNMELNLADSETSRALLKSRLDSLSSKSDFKDLDKNDAAEIQKIQDSLAANEKAHTALAKQYIAQAEALGSEEIEQGELRKAALGTASYFIESQRRYYESGDRALIDGVFTAEELVWLTTPHSMRDAQYRPDLVLAINEAMKPYHLFDPDFVPSKIPREASRRMLRLAKSLTEEIEPVHIPEIDDDPVSGEEDEIEDVLEQAPQVAAEPQASVAVSTPVVEPDRGVESFMAM